MTYNYTSYYQPGNYGYSGPVPDQLAQLRGAQMPMQPLQNPQPFGGGQMMQNPQQMAQPQPTVNQMIWVQGEAGAKSYIVANGNTVPLWDSENQTVYIKTVDASGMPSMRVLDYTERTAAPRMPAAAPQQALVDYVTRTEYDALLSRVQALESIPTIPIPAKKKPQKEDDE